MFGKRFCLWLTWASSFCTKVIQTARASHRSQNIVLIKKIPRSLHCALFIPSLNTNVEFNVKIWNTLKIKWLVKETYFFFSFIFQVRKWGNKNKQNGFFFLTKWNFHFILSIHKFTLEFLVTIIWKQINFQTPCRFNENEQATHLPTMRKSSKFWCYRKIRRRCLSINQSDMESRH